MNFDDFREALDNSTGKAGEMNTLVKVVQSYVLTAAQRALLKDKLDVAFSRADFADVAPFFPGLNPNAFDHVTAGPGVRNLLDSSHARPRHCFQTNTSSDGLKI